MTVRINPGSNDVLKNSSVLKKVNYTFYIVWFVIVLFYLNNYLLFFKSQFLIFWFMHLKNNPFVLGLIFIIVLSGFLIIRIVKFIRNININFSIDYFSAIFNFILFIILTYCTNTSYTFMFLLEVNSLIVLYKFSVSRFFLKKTQLIKNDEKHFEKNSPKFYLNMLFFQY